MGNLNCKNVNEGKIDLTNIKFYLQNHEDLNINTNNIKRLDKDILKVSNTENITFQNNKNEKKEEDNNSKNNNNSNNSNSSSSKEMILSSKEINSIPTPSSQSEESKKVKNEKEENENKQNNKKNNENNNEPQIRRKSTIINIQRKTPLEIIDEQYEQQHNKSKSHCNIIYNNNEIFINFQSNLNSNVNLNSNKSVKNILINNNENNTEKNLNEKEQNEQLNINNKNNLEQKLLNNENNNNNNNNFNTIQNYNYFLQNNFVMTSNNIPQNINMNLNMQPNNNNDYNNNNDNNSNNDNNGQNINNYIEYNNNNNINNKNYIDHNKNNNINNKIFYKENISQANIKVKQSVKNNFSPKKINNINQKENIVKWRKTKIKDIISLDQLSKLNNKIIILNNIFKVFTKKNSSNKLETTIKYVALTKSEIRIYRSKESILFEKNPLIRIPLFNIYKCDLYKNDNPYINNISLKGKNIYNFYIELKNLNNMKNEDKSLELNHLKKFENENRNNSFQKKKKKISFLKDIFNEHNSRNNTVIIKNDICEKDNSFLFVFSSENEKIINDWIALINYLIR